MKSVSFDNDHFFIPAIFLSVFIHGALIMATGWMPSNPQVSVINAPNSLELTVVSQPFVSVIEEEIVTEEIIEEEIPKEVIVSNPVKKIIPEQSSQPTMISRESQGAITEAKPLMKANSAPAYPWIARQRGWEGTVRLNVLIAKDGTLGQIGVAQSSGHGILDRAALKAVKNWKFTPAQSGPLRISSRISIPIQFTLVKEK